MSRNTNNRIVMVNSFKGGTGKTSVALSHCIYHWGIRVNKDDPKMQNYKNIYFIDIDRFGTSLAYSLFPGDKKLHYLNEYPRVSVDSVCNEIELADGAEGKSIYAVLLNPVANRKQIYDFHQRMLQHEKVNAAVFQENLEAFLEECMKRTEDNLFVVDCSPGLAEMERNILNSFYRNKNKYHLSIEEVYVTTFDAHQIRKTIESLNDEYDSLYRESREVSIVLNDLHNCQGIQRSDHNFLFDWKETARDILEQLDDKSVIVRFKQFEAEQLKANMIRNTTNLDNITGAYVLKQEYREGYPGRECKENAE